VPEQPAARQNGPELVMICRVSPSFSAVRQVESSLEQTLQASVDSFDFSRASLVLVRDGKPAVWWHAVKETRQSGVSEGIHAARCARLNDSIAAAEGKQKQKLLDPLYPVISTTLPVLLKAGDPVGMMEIGIFDIDYASARHMMAKAVSLARHIADIIQESLFHRQKDPHLRKLAVWMEMVNTISSTLDIRQVLHVVAQLTADLFSAKSCIYLLDETEQTLIPAVAVGSYDPALKQKFKALKGTKPFPAITRVIKKQQPVLVTPKNMARLLTPEIVSDFAYGWVVLAPILSKGKTVGIMQVDRPLETKGFDKEETEIIFAIARATAIAMENARLIEMLGQKEQLLHQLVNELITAEEDERKRLAADLHDGIIQSLIGIWYRLQRISPEVEAEPQKWYGEISALTNVLNDQIQEIRRILYDLRPIILDNYGLIPAVESYVYNLQEQQNLPVALSITGENHRLAPKIEVTLFRILQEALTNVIKHAGATRVKVGLAILEQEVTLSVEDNGSGINSARAGAPPSQNRLGLASIQERALLLGGVCGIDSRPGEGTRVCVRIPVQIEPARGAEGVH
jgi:signal transduction histidine kinase